MNVPRVKEGDVVTAEAFNRLVDAANASTLTVAQGSGLTLQSSPDGYVLGTTVMLPFYGKITGPISSGKYPFTVQIPAAGGTWQASPQTGTAWEVAGNTSVATNTYVKMWRTAAGDTRFLAGTC